MKKLFAVLLSVIMCFSVCACNFGEEEVDELNGEIDKNRKQLYVSIYDTGANNLDWVKEIKKMFEEKYPEYQLYIQRENETLRGDKLFAGIKNSKSDVFITSTIVYNDFVKNGKIADITDAITTPLTEWGETKSIEDKMDQDIKDFYKVDGKYYGLSHMDSLYGMMYDVDLFEERGFYFNEDMTDFTQGKDDDKSVGLDGVKGTYDDGLPVTYEQLKILFNQIIDSGCIPLTSAGKFPDYRNRFLNSVWASYEGLNDFRLNYTFNGNDSDFGKITNANAYKLQGQEGKKAALTFAFDTAKNQSWCGESFFANMNDNKAAQLEFLQSRITEGHKPVAILEEGSWWEEESTSNFNELVTIAGDKWSKENRRFGFMPMPRFIGTEGIKDQENTKTTLFIPASTAVIMKSNATYPEMAKNFIRLLHTDKAMKIFTKGTGTIKALNYEMTDEELNELTHYKRVIWEAYHSENTQRARILSNNLIRLQYPTDFDRWDWSMDGAKSDPMKNFNDDSKNEMSVQSYFEDLQKTWKESDWTKNYSKYF